LIVFHQVIDNFTQTDVNEPRSRFFRFYGEDNSCVTEREIIICFCDIVPSLPSIVDAESNSSSDDVVSTIDLMWFSGQTS
jgi:hypothetical protein